MSPRQNRYDKPGRPRHPETLIKRSIDATEKQWDTARTLGNGNESAGVRRALDLAQEEEEKS